MKIKDGVLYEISSTDIFNGHFEIPNNVHTIGENVFSNNNELRTITIPESVKKIEKDAFSHCNSLTTIEIPSSVEEIGKNAFLSCNNLITVKLNDGLKTIKDNAFEECSTLSNISLPTTLETIGKGVFFGCSSIKAINLPENLSVIESCLFSNCSSLSSVKMPKNLISIGAEAFSSCSSLKNIILPKTLKTINKSSFQHCSSIKKITIPSSVEVIDDHAFDYCSKLKKVNIENGVKFIGQAAFNCSGIKNITIPPSVTQIKNGAFMECSKLNRVDIQADIKSINTNLFYNCYSLKKVNLPESISSIGFSAFKGCDSLSIINIPARLKRIDDSAFESCKSLKSISLPEGIEDISSYTFSDCFSLESVTLPENLKSISSKAFKNCNSLKKANLPESLKSIGDSAFENCYLLQNLTFPSSLKTIEEKAFQKCNRLTKIDLPESLEKVGNNAFSNCYYLEQIIVPKNIKKMGIITGYSFPFFAKKDNKLLFSKSADPEIPQMETIKLNLSLISSYWDYADMLLKEQKNEYVCEFYNSFLQNLPRNKVEEFLNSHNFTFFKQIASKYHIKQKETYKVLYNLGGFNQPIEYNGKTINYAQKVIGFLQEKLDKKAVAIEKINNIGYSMMTLGFKKEFTDFFLESFDEFIAEDNNRYGFISRSYEKFEEIQKTNTSNRGSQRQLKPTIKKFKEYLDEHRYEGITEETRPIANAISPYFGAQSIFDKSVSVMREKERSNTPDHILSIHLKEEKPEKTNMESFENIDELSSKIKESQTQILDNLSNVSENEFTYDWLSKNDPNNLILGKLCSCCAHIDGMGYGIMRASIVHKNFQNLVVRNSKNEIVAKSTLYINPKEGYGIFNNIEVNNDLMHKLNSEKMLRQIYEKYILGVREFVKQYNKEHPDKPLKQVNVGMSLNDLDSLIKEFHENDEEMLEPVDYGIFQTNGATHIGDSFYSQYILWKQDDNSKNNSNESLEK